MIDNHFVAFGERVTESRLKTKPYDLRGDFSLPIVNFPFLYTNIISLTGDTIFKSLHCMSWFSWYMVTVYSKAIKVKFQSGDVETFSS